MSIETLDFAEPFFTIRLVADEAEYKVGDKTILLSLSERPIGIQDQSLAFLSSVIVANTPINGIERAILIERFADRADEQALFDRVKKAWPLAFDVRKEERLRGVAHHLSPKVTIGNLRPSLYHSGSVPLNVGLHQDHPFCDVPGFKEVHTQIIGYGKMQQCLEQDVGTLYLEEPMAPGTIHKPMYDDHGNYPWHQYETITPSIFMAVELVPGTSGTGST
ncbi:MAG: hypothetical protein ACR2RF_31475 [Geminicoccaceae bacterium]